MLIAEDTPVTRAIVGALEDTERYRCLQHLDLENARGTLAMVRPDLFLADMPYRQHGERLVDYLLDTFQAIREIRDDGQLAYPYESVPRIALTDQFTQRHLLDSFSDIHELIHGFIRKPVDFSTLVADIDRFVEEDSNSA
jgi:CheY-like chemotaxis protein